MHSKISLILLTLTFLQCALSLPVIEEKPEFPETPETSTPKTPKTPPTEVHWEEPLGRYGNGRMGPRGGKVSEASNLGNPHLDDFTSRATDTYARDQNCVNRFVADPKNVSYDRFLFFFYCL